MDGWRLENAGYYGLDRWSTGYCSLVESSGAGGTQGERQRQDGLMDGLNGWVRCFLQHLCVEAAVYLVTDEVGVGIRIVQHVLGERQNKDYLIGGLGVWASGSCCNRVLGPRLFQQLLVRILGSVSC